MDTDINATESGWPWTVLESGCVQVHNYFWNIYFEESCILDLKPSRARRWTIFLKYDATFKIEV